MRKQLIAANLAAGLSMALLLCSCGTDPHRIDPNGTEGLTTVYDINAKDWQMAADSCINEMIKTGALDRVDGRRTIIAITGIQNNTATHVDASILTNMIREALLKSGKAMTTTAWTGTGGAEDPATRNVRSLAGDPLFDHRTVQPQGTAIAPDMAIAGQIIQIMANKGRYEESTIYFHLTLTDLKTGLAVWEGQSAVAKQGKRSVFGS